jgi:protein-disulfide isomerase
MSEEENKKVVKIVIPHVNPWMIATLVLAIAAVFIYLKGFQITGMATGLTLQQATNKATGYINENLIQSGTVSVVSAEEMSGLYKITVSYQAQKIPVYITKDGLYLFVSQPINTSEEIANDIEEPQEIPKKDKPTVELFVMSFCPYGVQAETLMKPVVDLLGTKADIKIRFIASVQGDTVDTVESLHGITEAQEDLRQLCIMKYYNQKTFWDYLTEIDNNCYGKINTGDAAALDTCWKNAATKTGIDAAKIQTCSNSTEGLNLLKADEQLTEKYGVSGSPTLIINGVEYSGSRSSEAFKQAICNAFTTAPAECSQTLSSSGSESSGGCE